MRLKSNKSKLFSPGERVTKVASWRDGRTSSAERGYDHDWRVARADYLRENTCCVMCWRLHRRVTPSAVVDHIRPHGGNAELLWNRKNWQALCKTCHNSTKQRQERASAAGRNLSPQVTRARQAYARGLTEDRGGVKVTPSGDT